jgi:osmoprotectant transport system ATP-binding protein
VRRRASAHRARPPPDAPPAATGCAGWSVDLKIAYEVKGTVGEHHATLTTTIRATENLRTAVSTMFRYDVTWLACVDDDGVYIGYVTLRSITQLLAGAYRDG